MAINGKEAVLARYGSAAGIDLDALNDPLITSMLVRGSCRAFREQSVSEDTVAALCAAALASPTKSDLQQRDIVLLRSAEKRNQLAKLVSGQAWVANAPMIAVFCGNNRRQRLLHQHKDIPFANDHLDAFFNAVGDAAIALGAFVAAAEAIGLGCCPISAVRNEAQAVSELLKLPAHVFPFAGLAFGYPACPPAISKRLPLPVTCHFDLYEEIALKEAFDTYDADRVRTQPYAQQRDVETFGESETYSWSDDKVRQYSKPERADFGAFVRAHGFNLD